MQSDRRGKRREEKQESERDYGVRKAVHRNEKNGEKEKRVGERQADRWRDREGEEYADGETE